MTIFTHSHISNHTWTHPPPSSLFPPSFSKIKNASTLTFCNKEFAMIDVFLICFLNGNCYTAECWGIIPKILLPSRIWLNHLFTLPAVWLKPHKQTAMSLTENTSISDLKAISDSIDTFLLLLLYHSNIKPMTVAGWTKCQKRAFY